MGLVPLGQTSLRNGQMLQGAYGTADMIRRAKEAGVKVIQPDQSPTISEQKALMEDFKSLKDRDRVTL